MRARLTAFKGDIKMLNASKAQLRIEFSKNKEVADPKKIGTLMQPNLGRRQSVQQLSKPRAQALKSRLLY